MNRLVCLFAAVAAMGLVSRLPSPAVDVGKLEPVSLVRLAVESGEIRVETDTGAEGFGGTLEEAMEDLQRGASGVVFLDTADYLLLSGNSEAYLTQIFQAFRPGCRVCKAEGQMDLKAAAEYLAVHTPERTLGDLRAGMRSLETLTLEGGRGALEGS